MKVIIVRLDDARYGAGPATVIAVDSDVPKDRDGCKDHALRRWADPGGDARVGDRVAMRQTEAA